MINEKVLRGNSKGNATGSAALKSTCVLSVLKNKHCQLAVLSNRKYRVVKTYLKLLVAGAVFAESESALEVCTEQALPFRDVAIEK